MAADLTGGATLLYRTGSEMNYRIGPGESRVGFEKGNEVRIPLDGVSRQHAKIFQEGEDYFLEDAGSSNGTFLNGRRVTRRQRLRHLDVVSLGRNLDLIFIRRSAEKRIVRNGVRGAWLEVLDGIDQGSRREVPRGSLTIGRAASCNVVADSKLVSQIHARIERTGSALMVTDLQSSNGTAVNGERIETRILKDRDVIELAGSRHYRVNLEEGQVETRDVPRQDFEGSVSLPMDWQTRIEWTPGEKAAFDRAREPGGPGRPIPKPPVILAPPPLAPKGKPEAKPAAPARSEKPAKPAEKPAAAEAAKTPSAAGAKAPSAAGAKAPSLEEKPVGEKAAPAEKPEKPVPAEHPVKPAEPAAAKPPAPAAPSQKPAPAAKPEPPPPPATAPPAPASAEPPSRATVAAPPEEAAAAAKAPAAAATSSEPAPPPAASTAGASVRAATVGVPPAPAPAAAAAAPAGPAAPVTPADPSEAPTRRQDPEAIAAALAETRLVARKDPNLRVQLEGDSGSFDLPRGEYSVGRLPGSGVYIESPEVSRRHARILVEREDATIEDLESGNGTFVNGRRLTSPQMLADGDEVGFGDLKFRARLVRS